MLRVGSVDLVVWLGFGLKDDAIVDFLYIK
jgi:hypothetical protein